MIPSTVISAATPTATPAVAIRVLRLVTREAWRPRR